MKDLTPNIIRLSARISALEKANRRWKMGGLLLFILLMSAALLTGFKVYARRSPAAHIPSAVVAHEFVLMGPHGRALGRIAVIHGKPALQFYNSDGQLWWFAPPKFSTSPVKIK